MSPLVTIITPCYNAETFIEKTIQSVINQSYKNIQYIIIDGGSSDGTHKILEQYKNKVSEIIIEKDDGMYTALNKGIERSEGEIIAYLNSDDLYFHDTVFNAVNTFKSNPEIKLIYGDLKVIDWNDEILYDWIYPNFRWQLFVSNNFCTIGQATSFWRKAVHKKVGLFDNKLKMAGDFDFFAKVGKEFKILKINRFLACYRVHQNSLTNKGKLKNEIEIKTIHQKYLDTNVKRSLRLPMAFLQKTIFRILNYKYVLKKILKST